MSTGLIRYKTHILNYLDENSYNIFTLKQIKSDFNHDFDSVFRALKSLVKAGVILNLQKGLYCRPGFSDQNVLAYYLAPKGSIAYWSALHFYGLTDQFPNTVFVQTPTLIREKTIIGTHYKFIKVNPDKLVQIEVHGRGNSKFAITSIEKTIVDCFDLMEYSGGWEVLIHGLKSARLNNQKLIEACHAVNNISAIKRLGYLIEIMEKQSLKTFVNYALNKLNNRYNLLDPSGDHTGNYYSRWKLQLNVGAQDILSSNIKMY
jgi:predicted transcriptional regulator of viral defense system